MRPPLPPGVEAFLAEPRLATLTTLRPDGSPHVVAVRFTWDRVGQLARVLTVASSRKARNVLARPGGRVALCQAVGFRWVTLEGGATISGAPERVYEAARRYAARYGAPPPEPPGRIAIEISVDRAMSLNI
ncbi:F420-dependent biliverdin reductase [Rugosimonospora acidiphila]|uniref:F420-dependent biliverdin reductase n=1 Tax=Rugosimonospora acidiphila TaxID=556531 RepID=A0ABP9RUH0_9ACTN